jgi:hypothetical protein
MHTYRLPTLFALVTCAFTACGAVRGPLTVQSNSGAGFECGKPNGPCGSAIPAGVNCPNGPGWCQSGYYCGWQRNTQEPSKCLRIPPNCGTAGNPCCPSNTKRPHATNEDKLKAKPYCQDGSYCFYFPTMAGADNGDIFAGNPGEQQTPTVEPLDPD